MHKCETQLNFDFTETLYCNENTFCMSGVGKVKSEECKMSMCVINPLPANVENMVSSE
jgi:hypothetical protein